MFLIFIHDLPDNIRSSDHLFANDCVLYRNINSLTDCQILQGDMNSLANESLILCCIYFCIKLYKIRKYKSKIA